MKRVELEPGVWLHGSGALWLEPAAAALIADVHLGYAWAMRRRGQLGPPGGGGVEERLSFLMDDLRPRRLIVLGDLVHAPRPGVEERMEIEAQIQAVRKRTELVLVRGNHDRGFARDFEHLGVPVVEEWRAAGWQAVHGHGAVERHADHRLAVGHFHPAVRVRDAAGARRKWPAFVVYPKLLALPAFSPFAAGVEGPAGFKALGGEGRARVFVVTGAEVAELL